MYPVPGAAGELEVGQRRLMWAWYVVPGADDPLATFDEVARPFSRGEDWRFPLKLSKYGADIKRIVGHGSRPFVHARQQPFLTI